jgi:hypothetical protein
MLLTYQNKSSVMMLSTILLFLDDFMRILYNLMYYHFILAIKPLNIVYSTN